MAVPTRILFICTGNICRSPTAEAVMRHKLSEAGLCDRVQIDSAGTHGYHVGGPADRRSQEAARQRGYQMDDLRARAVQPEDFVQFDHLLVMDKENIRDLRPLCPEERLFSRVELFLAYAKSVSVREVPDPYYGSGEGFALVLDLVEAACDGLLARIQGDGPAFR